MLTSISAWDTNIPGVPRGLPECVCVKLKSSKIRVRVLPEDSISGVWLIDRHVLSLFDVQMWAGERLHALVFCSNEGEVPQGGWWSGIKSDFFESSLWFPQSFSGAWSAWKRCCCVVTCCWRWRRRCCWQQVQNPFFWSASHSHEGFMDETVRSSAVFQVYCCSRAVGK